MIEKSDRGYLSRVRPLSAKHRRRMRFHVDEPKVEAERHDTPLDDLIAQAEADDPPQEIQKQIEAAIYARARRVRESQAAYLDG